MAEILFSFGVCVCVCVCARAEDWSIIAQKRLKLRTSNFDAHVSKDSPDMKIFCKGGWPGSRDHLNFWALNASISKTVIATDFKFHKHVNPRDSVDMTP